jgi:hypothetical protein
MTTRPKFNKGKPPYHVDVWEERDNLQISIVDANDTHLWTWTDDERPTNVRRWFFRPSPGRIQRA